MPTYTTRRPLNMCNHQHVKNLYSDYLLHQYESLQHYSFPSVTSDAISLYSTPSICTYYVVATTKPTAGWHGLRFSFFLCVNLQILRNRRGRIFHFVLSPLAIIDFISANPLVAIKLQSQIRSLALLYHVQSA